MVIATGCAVLLLVQVAADRRAHSAAQSGARELRHARAVLAAELAPLPARDLLVVSDTLLAMHSQLGVVTVCASDSTGVDVASAAGLAPTAWLESTRAGDVIRAWSAGGAPNDAPQPLMLALVVPARRLGAGPCGASVVRQRWRLALAGLPAVGAPLLVGAPLEAHREVQYVHYRSNGRWWLGRRARDGATWETVQPVAGPLESPARGGLTMRGLDVAGAVTTRVDSMAAIALVARVPRVARPTTPAAARRVVLPPDSLVTELPLRAESWTRGLE